VHAGLREFLLFGAKQAYACIFAGSFLAAVIATHLWYPADAGLHRYDALLLIALGIQACLLAFRLERWSECAVIILFHLLATGMELFKTAVGSWVYPEPADWRIAGVPLFAGFMYSAVGSYIARIWRIFAFGFTALPGRWSLLGLSAAIYANFFTHHYIIDLRWVILAWMAWSLRRTWVHFTVDRARRRMPLLLGLVLVALFIWLAENLATWCRVWAYPDQLAGWTPVSPTKLVAWLLLMFVSFALVALLHPRSDEPAR
jgi:uncharacterized membrane protein YoaT (DUF817 family)